MFTGMRGGKEKNNFYLFLSFAHVENNKALLKIAFNRKKKKRMIY
jgi:hypothetical protein